mmetsp:Transcript_54954/g.139327  ORF Transcript_54954/g.139327 Transcript_54954/m.139327 type:complete len:398 (+) Transcript_54954:38-1231(+)
MDDARPAKMQKVGAGAAPAPVEDAARSGATVQMPRFQQTMLRVKDPKVSVPFYERNFEMKLVHWMKFSNWGFTVYFLERQREGQISPPCSMEQTSVECEHYLHSMEGTTVELTHNHGTEADPNFKGYWNGNTGKDASGDLFAETPAARGFGHIAFNVDDVDDACAKLEKSGVSFQKKPNEGRMKGLAFALDPDGYWIEICSRTGKLGWPEHQNLSQTMLRVKDGPRSVEFYTKHLGMTLLRRSDFEKLKFSLFFLASLSPEELRLAADERARRRTSQKSRARSSSPSSSSSSSDDGLPSPSELWNPVLELTWNHGTEHDADFRVHDGNSEPRGFGHIGFLVDDIEGTCARMEADGVQFKKRPADGNMRGIAFAYDPNGYWVELIDRKASFAGVCDNY